MKEPVSFCTRLIALCLLGHFALSWPLWHAGYRVVFPLIPVFDLPFPQTDIWAAVHAWLTVIVCLLLLWRPKRPAPELAIAWLMWMVAQDITRLQPWMYFYLLALGLVVFDRASNTAAALRWLLAAVYCWGGFNKLTPYFAEDNFPWFCEAFSWTQPLGNWPAAGYGVALAELLFAPGLLWHISRPFFRWIVPAFHVFIIFALSPLGLDWNTVVIPWNLAMGGMVWALSGPDATILFSPRRHRDTEKRFMWDSRQNIMPFILLLLAWFMPLLNLFHRWPGPLSWTMYTNTQTEATFFREVNNQQVEAVDPSERYVQHIWEKYAYDNGRKLLLDDWAFEEIQVPAFNSRFAFIRLAHYLCPHKHSTGDTGLLLLSVERWDKSAEKWETVPCAQILR